MEVCFVCTATGLTYVTEIEVDCTVGDLKNIARPALYPASCPSIEVCLYDPSSDDVFEDNDVPVAACGLSNGDEVHVTLPERIVWKPLLSSVLAEWAATTATTVVNMQWTLMVVLARTHVLMSPVRNNYIL